ncbi:MAG TPA: hydroxymethylglutaryl-CoA reductase, degradative [Candidatus Sulfomarinibacteraceae bacterium]|nr:hydroxymethylglutaryl-CoA reductase, degradative [Candidatus Sulfomarinibacteraceae bacterium]
MISSSFPSFHKLSVSERLRTVRDRGLLSSQDTRALLNGAAVLDVRGADTMIENVIGVMGLPIGLGVNFLVNGKDYVVPLVVEEPSIVAALSYAAKTARAAGGFTATSDEPILIGQIQLVDVPHAARARQVLESRKEEILNLANSLHPRMVARGGGAVDLEVVLHPGTSDTVEMLVVQLLVDTRNAMGANLVNTMCEGIASFVESLTGGRVFLRILSNLADRSLVRARVEIPVAALAGNGHDGEQVRDGIIIASQFAAVDPHRAATHNKGIMNGIDAVALATGNDWRAVEAGAHAYAARGPRYTSLSRWCKGDNGALVGSIELPLRVGIVGGPMQSNPSVGMNLRLTRVESSQELAELMAAVGLAQNFSALRALVTDGIQRGHMTLHARTVATAAGATPEIFDTVVERLVESGEIKVWKAREIVAEIRAQLGADMTREDHPELAAGHGKIILFGEHAVVYGSRAIAAPVPLAVRARVVDDDEGVWLVVPRWGVEQRLRSDPAMRTSYEEPAALILEHLGLSERPMRIVVHPELPRAMGLGGSAAVAVAIIRALDRHFRLGLSDDEVNALAYRCECVAHGTPSGLDNTVATFGQPLVYRRGDPPEILSLAFREPVSFVIGMTGVESLTAKMVARVRSGRERNPDVYDTMIKGIDAVTGQALEAIRSHDLERLGELMNVNQGLLNGMQVSSWELEELIQIAREHGALGAKLTGGGGGGSMIALAPDTAPTIIAAMENAGYRAMEVRIG